MPAHHVTITLLLMVMLLHPQRLQASWCCHAAANAIARSFVLTSPQIQKMGNRHGFVFSLTSLWTMFDQVSCPTHGLKEDRRYASTMQQFALTFLNRRDATNMLTDGKMVQTSLKASLNLAVVRSTAMLIAQMDDMRRIWGKLWVPQATQDLQIFIFGGVVMPLVYNLFKEVGAPSSWNPELKRPSQITELHSWPHPCVMVHRHDPAEDLPSSRR